MITNSSVDYQVFERVFREDHLKSNCYFKNIFLPLIQVRVLLRWNRKCHSCNVYFSCFGLFPLNLKKFILYKLKLDTNQSATICEKFVLIAFPLGNLIQDVA